MLIVSGQRCMSECLELTSVSKKGKNILFQEDQMFHQCLCRLDFTSVEREKERLVLFLTLCQRECEMTFL